MSKSVSRGVKLGSNMSDGVDRQLPRLHIRDVNNNTSLTGILKVYLSNAPVCQDLSNCCDDKSACWRREHNWSYAGEFSPSQQ